MGRDALGRPTLLAAADARKDQSYVLYPVSAEVLGHLMLPLGGMGGKDEVRALAAERGLDCAHKHDSQDICFVPDGDYVGFLERRSGRAPEPGHIVDSEGRVVGWHGGMERYTIGQRKGLGLATGRRVYVVEKDAATNTVRVGDDAELFSTCLSAGEAVWSSGERWGEGGDVPAAAAAATTGMRVAAVVCYHGRRHPARLVRTGEESFRLEFERPVRAIAPGQSVVCYDGDRVVCGGTILP